MPLSRTKYKVMDSGIHQKSDLKNIILSTLLSVIYLPKFKVYKKTAIAENTALNSNFKLSYHLSQ